MMTRPSATPAATTRMTDFHADVTTQVREAVEQHAIVVVGMGWNPHVIRARRALDAAGVAYHYLGYGNYASRWKARLAIKLWSGWPTFPQVFVDRELIGGATEALAWLAEGGAEKAPVTA